MLSYLGRFCVVFLAFFASIPAHSISDFYLLTGSNIAVGNDGAIESFYNPAYLAFPENESKISISYDQTSGLNILPIVSFLDSSILKSSYSISGLLGFAYHSLFIENLSLGLTIGSNGDPILNKIDLSGPFKSNNNLSVKLNNQETALQGALGIAYKFGKVESLGLSFKYAMYKTNSKIEIDTTGFNQAEDTQQNIQKMGITLSYVFHLDDGDIGIIFTPGILNTISTSESQIQNLIKAEDSLTNQTIEAPYLGAGFSEIFFKRIKIFAEAGLNFPVKNTLTEIEFDNNKAVKFDQEVNDAFSMVGSFGFSLKILDFFNIYAGVRAQKTSQTIASVNQVDNTNTETKSTDGEFVGFQFGVGLSKILPFDLFAGAVISRFTQSEKKLTYKSNVATEETTDIQFSNASFVLSVRSGF